MTAVSLGPVIVWIKERFSECCHVRKVCFCHIAVGQIVPGPCAFDGIEVTFNDSGHGHIFFLVFRCAPFKEFRMISPRRQVVNNGQLNHIVLVELVLDYQSVIKLRQIAHTRVRYNDNVFDPNSELPNKIDSGLDAEDHSLP